MSNTDETDCVHPGTVTTYQSFSYFTEAITRHKERFAKQTSWASMDVSAVTSGLHVSR